MPLYLRKSYAFPTRRMNSRGCAAAPLAGGSGGIAAKEFFTHTGEAELHRKSSGKAANVGKSHTRTSDPVFS